MTIAADVANATTQAAEVVSDAATNQAYVAQLVTDITALQTTATAFATAIAQLGGAGYSVSPAGAITPTLVSPAAAPAPPTAPATATEFGFHADIYRDSVGYVANIARLQSLGARVVRNILPRYDVATAADAKLAATVAALNTAKLDHIWCCTDNNVPALTASTWATWLATQVAYWSAMAAQQKGLINNWSLWNEWNLTTNGFANVAHYLAWAVPVYAAMKAAAPGATITIGAVCSLTAVGAGNTAGIAALRACYGAGFYADGVDLHPYGAVQLAPIANQNALGDVATVRALQVGAGHGADACWITEYGLTESTDAAMALDVPKAFAIVSGIGGVSKCCWFLLNENASWPTSGAYSTAGAVTAIGAAFAKAV